jgi:hypothetical protein
MGRNMNAVGATARKIGRGLKETGRWFYATALVDELREGNSSLHMTLFSSILHGAAGAVLDMAYGNIVRTSDETLEHSGFPYFALMGMAIPIVTNTVAGLYKMIRNEREIQDNQLEKTLDEAREIVANPGYDEQEFLNYSLRNAEDVSNFEKPKDYDRLKE